MIDLKSHSSSSWAWDGGTKIVICEKEWIARSKKTWKSV